MKILVLGNGFDLDHNLPTSYMDFLNFCNFVLDIDNPESKCAEKLSPIQIEYSKCLKECPEVKETFLTFIKNNKLIKYFNNRLSKQGENWIDFEREIKGIVNAFKSLEFEFKESNKHFYIADRNHKIQQILDDLGLDSVKSGIWDEYTLNAIHNDLCYQLNNFSQALEYYIATFINTTPVNGIAPDIVDFNADEIISFNYSNTYERHYGGIKWKENVEHVHGLASSGIVQESNIILGITSNENDLQNCYVEFEKYYQRITKKIGSNYKKWLNSRKGTKTEIEVMFFGHSLDSTDSDIIKDLIFDENTTVYIYYHNEKTHQQIVANLIEIIGKEVLIQFVSGTNPKIQFIKQQKHQEKNTGGIEIDRDTGTLYRMHLKSEIQIQELLLKIEKKIHERDKLYFHSQKKAISLFEALKYHKIEFALVDEFAEICGLLDFETNKYGKLIYYYDYDWCYHTVSGYDIECDKETTELINRLNKSNEKRIEKLESEKVYGKVLHAKTIDEVKGQLLVLFSQTETDNKFWDQMHELFGYVKDDKNFEYAIKSLGTENYSHSISSRIKHFIDMYEEYCFVVEYEKQMAENYQDENADY